MASFKGRYFHEHEDAEPSREVPLKATNQADAEREAQAGMREDEKRVEVVQDAAGSGDFTLDQSELGGSDRLT